MPDCAHHFLLEAPQNGRIPGRCKDCGAERDWPAHGVVAEGRPFILRDPLLSRTHQNGVGGYRRTQDYY
jgi:hypothetical protein